MGVNGVVDNAGSQQMAVAASKSVLVQLKELEQKEPRDTRTQKVHTESSVSKLLQEGTSASKAGMNVLLGLASKLANAGVTLKAERFSGKAKDALENEYGNLLGGKEDFTDTVDVITRISKQAKQNQGGQNGQDKGEVLDRETQGTVKEYAALYAQSTVNGSQEIKKKLEKLEKMLRQKGLTNKDFISIKTAVKNSIRKEIAEQVKDAFLKKVLSKEKSIEMVIQDKSLNDVLDFALLRGVHDHKSLQRVADDVMQDTASEIKDFARDKIEEKLISKHLSPDAKAEEKATNELKELLKLASKAGLNLDEFTENWKAKQFHLGMFIPDIPLGQGGMNADAQNQKEKNPYEFTKEDEKDLLVSRLRALHMHRALTGDWKTMLETHFKMRKLKNGLIKLGVSSNEFARIEKEGGTAARMRLLEMLKTVLEERATLYELAGPAFKLIEQKIKGILSNLERLGWKLDATEFNSIRDSANLKVFDAAREELLTLKDIVSGAKNPALEKRLSLVLKLMRRIKEESKLSAEIPEETYVVKEAV